MEVVYGYECVSYAVLAKNNCLNNPFPFIIIPNNFITITVYIIASRHNNSYMYV